MRGGLRVLTCVGGLAALVAVPRPARAGRTDFGWLYGTEVLPQRGVELQSWLAEENRVDGSPGQETQWWLAPAIGLTDQLELVLPVQLNRELHTEGDYSGLWSYGAELRYRFVSSDPVDRPAFAPLLRVAVNRMVYWPDAVDAQADLVGSYEHGRLLVAIDLGVDARVSSNDAEFTLDDGTTSGHQITFWPDAGVSVRVATGLRVGVESHGEFPEGGGAWLVVGPDLAWSFGRFWLSAAYGIGVGFHGGDAPKVQWGIAF